MLTTLKKTLLATFALFLSTGAQAFFPKVPTSEQYESGRFLCGTKFKNVLDIEQGFWTDVPVDYSRPEKGTTPVYAYFAGGFDPQKKTILYFAGGPGDTAHWRPFQVEVGFNVLVLEQRGIGCSRPDTLEAYLNPEFYSSENIARDAEMVRQKAGVSRLTVFGVSYGTVPATIYASLFPDKTRALILEGVIYSGDSLLWEASHRRKILQRMLNTLPADIKVLLSSVPAMNPIIPETWFSQLARNMLTSNNGLSTLTEKLLDLRKPESFGELIKHLTDLFTPMDVEPHPLFISDEIFYHMISCQELNLANPHLITADTLIDGVRLVPVKNTESPAVCAMLKAKRTQTYIANQYPVQVPVTYFQGSQDSATVAPAAIKHFKDVPKGPAQLMILVKGGHSPNLTDLNMETEGQLEIFQAAALGEPISNSLIEKFNAKSPLKWVTTSKK